MHLHYRFFCFGRRTRDSGWEGWGAPVSAVMFGRQVSGREVTGPWERLLSGPGDEVMLEVIPGAGSTEQLPVVLGTRPGEG